MPFKRCWYLSIYLSIASCDSQFQMKSIPCNFYSIWILGGGSWEIYCQFLPRWQKLYLPITYLHSLFWSNLLLHVTFTLRGGPQKGPFPPSLDIFLPTEGQTCTWGPPLEGKGRLERKMGDLPSNSLVSSPCKFPPLHSCAIMQVFLFSSRVYWKQINKQWRKSEKKKPASMSMFTT